MKKMKGAMLVAMQSYAHASTDDINRRRTLLIRELELARDNIAETRQRLAVTQRREREIVAELEGLTEVISKR